MQYSRAETPPYDPAPIRRRGVLAWLGSVFAVGSAPATVELVRRGGWILRRTDLR